MLTAEQSGQFNLTLNLTANPPPTNFGLSKNGIPVPRVPADIADMFFSHDTVTIPTVQHSHGAKYVISCSNVMGSTQFPFQLKVIGETEFIDFLKLIAKKVKQFASA